MGKLFRFLVRGTSAIAFSALGGGAVLLAESKDFPVRERVAAMLGLAIDKASSSFPLLLVFFGVAGIIGFVLGPSLLHFGLWLNDLPPRARTPS
jgi:hypothetical protein